MRGLAVAMIVVFHCDVLSGSPVGARFHNFLGGMFLGVDLFFVLSGYLLALGWLPLRWLGVIGYSVFLWRLPLIFSVNQYPSVAALTGVAHYKKLLELVIPMVVVLGILGYQFVELPCIARGAAKSKREPKQPAVERQRDPAPERREAPERVAVTVAE